MMKKEKTTLILFAILALLAFAPMVQEHLHFPRIRPLAGVTEPFKVPKLNFKNYLSGHYQRSIEYDLKQHYGFRPITIRLYNQYLWDFYKKTYTRLTVSQGKEGWLYEPWFVEDYYHGGTYNQKKDSLQMAQELHQEAFRLYQLQHLLDSFGTKLFVCLAPGKDLVYPEYLPDDTDPTRPKKLSARTFYQDEFNTLGINHINMEQWFLSMKDTVDYLLFPQKGTHWSNAAAMVAADSIIRYLEDQLDITMNERILSKPYIDKPRKPDYDLEELLNLSRPMKKLPQHYIDMEVKPRKGAVKPHMIVIGDSFYWNICNQLPMDSLFSLVPYWYYNSTIYHDPDHQSVKDVDLVKALLDADAVMLIYSSTQLYKMSDGFSKQALMALCFDDDDIEAAEKACIAHINSNPKWLASLKERAEKYHQPLDDFKKAEAKWQVQLYPQRYLPALLDSIPTKRSSRVNEYLTLKSAAHGIQ